MAGENCLGCGRSMQGKAFSICPHCGRYMATRTGGEVAAIFAVSIMGAVVVCVGLVVILWNFA
jgi:uncharacterized protein (DUF983 family)